MASAALFEALDGTLEQNLVLTTNRKAVTVKGTVGTNIIDVQVSINNAGFVSDPSLVYLDGTSFTVPNLEYVPEGLAVPIGRTIVAIRTIDLVGGISAVSTAEIVRTVSPAKAEAVIPTGIRVHRRREDVDILVSTKKPTQTAAFGDALEFRGFNFYASTDPGGTTGKFRVNARPVTVVSEQEEELSSLESKQSVFTPIGTASVLRVRVTQENAFGEILGTVREDTIPIQDVATDLKYSSLLENRSLDDFVAFRHSRRGTLANNTVNSDQFSDIPLSTPLYYTVTALYYDVAQNIEFETPASQEVLAAPLTISTNIEDLPTRTQRQITANYIDAIQKVNAEISLIPGSISRDVDIDPFASEAERIWFILDFVHRSQSFLTLLAIDDANNDGVSDPVSSSSYKQALKAALSIGKDSQVQDLIDIQFDKLGGNFTIPRLSGRPAVGQVVFFTKTRPTKNLTISSGAIVSTNADPDNGLPAVRYIVGGTYIMQAANADAYYNFDTQQYEIIADIVAETSGTAGNRSAGQIKNVASGASGFSVTNREATTFGNSRESNFDYALRAQLGFVSVDSGTEGGYSGTVAGSTGIVKSKIVKSGDPLMMRDYDEVRHKHIGGKVDVWVQGLRERTVTETFAFAFAIAKDIRCSIIDLGTLTFRVLDDRVTVDNPLVELLNDPSQGLGVRNVSLGQDYDLTGVLIVDHETFRLNTTIAQPVTFIGDVITADFRFRNINQYRLQLQPVRRIVSVVGQSSGTLDSELGYDLYKTDDPLLTGESTIAQDYIVVNQINDIPTGDILSVTDESHVLVGFFEEPLRNVGINQVSVKVFNLARTIEYAGPLEANSDFDLVPGTATTPIKLVRTAISTIVDGQTVVVDYQHDENFTVTYVVNDLLQQLQQKLNSKRHVTADVLVKQAIQNSIDVVTTVQLLRGASKDVVDPQIRTNHSLELNSKLIGQGAGQSDIINAIDSTPGVDFQVIPLAKMGYADGARKLRETLLSTNTRLPSLDQAGNYVYVLNNPLKYPTIDRGGKATEHSGVFSNDILLTMATSLSTVGASVNTAYIVGESITVDGVPLKNKVVVSLDSTDLPEQHNYTASYVVYNDSGSHDIQASQVEHIDQGDLSLTIKEVK